MHNSRVILLHLSLIEGIGSGALAKLLARFAPEELERLYAFSASDLSAQYGISSELAQTIKSGLADRTLLEKELELLERYVIPWICLFDEQYPTLLKNIHLPPLILYYKGMLPNVYDALAVVGSREANGYAKQAIDCIVPPLVAQNWLIVSGGARGADTMAHEATLAAGGKTVAVLGSGLLNLYPAINKRLFDEITASGGALVSAFPLLMEPLAPNFPARNRIIAGLSRGCLVVQAAQKSGARITAEYCLTQGRDVFAIPGLIDDPLSAGCHALIQQGAKLVTGATDILAEFGQALEQKEKKPDEVEDQLRIIPARPTEFTLEDSIVHFCKKPCSIDELLEHTQIPLIQLSTLLFDLQIKGQVMQNMAGLWEKSY